MAEQHVYHQPQPPYPASATAGWYAFTSSNSSTSSSSPNSSNYSPHHVPSPPSHHPNNTHQIHDNYMALVDLKRGTWDDEHHRRGGDDDGDVGEEEDEGEGAGPEDEGGYDEEEDAEARRARGEEDEESLQLSEEFLAGTADPSHSIISPSCMRSRDAAELKVINSLTLVGIVTRIVKKVIQKSPAELVFSKQMFIRNNWLSKQTYAIGFKAKLITMFLVTTIQQYQMLDADESDLSTLHRVRVLPKAFILAKVKLPRTVVIPPAPPARPRGGRAKQHRDFGPRRSNSNSKMQIGELAETAEEVREGMDASVVEVQEAPPSNSESTNPTTNNEHDTEEEEDKSNKKNGYTPHTPRTPLQRNTSDPNLRPPTPNNSTSSQSIDTNSATKVSELDLDTEEEAESLTPSQSVRGGSTNGTFNGPTNRVPPTRQIANYEPPAHYADDYGYYYPEMYQPNKKARTKPPPLAHVRHMSQPNIRYSPTMPPTPPTPPIPPIPSIPPPSERDIWVEFLSRVGRSEESVKGWPIDALREELELQNFRGAKKGDVMNMWRSLQQL